MNTTPAISVVMAAYEGAPFLRETIASLGAQTMPDFEIIVVDDCSKDDTVALLASIDEPRLRVFRAPRNGGPAVARTIAMTHARGRHIAGLDQDDLCRPDRFAAQLAWLDAHPQASMVTSTVEMVGNGPVRADPWPDLVDPGLIDWTMTLLNPLAWSTALIRSDAARALDPFERDERRYAEDFDLYHRVRRHGVIGRIAEPLVRYRLHAGGASQAFEDRMIASAAAVLAERYGNVFYGEEMAAALLMSRHAGASHAPPDADTLADCGRVMARLLGAFGGLAPDQALPVAIALWWRIARTGLRAGHYGMFEMLRARPSFVAGGFADPGRVAEDAAIGTVRRLITR
jgi:glycosyltransferase involved in cell wall biosynthesis